MMLRSLLVAGVIATGLASATPVLACGDGEAPTSCDDSSPNGFASWMLGRVSKALANDKATALDKFSRGTDGFRTADTYVFCMGPDGMMTAHSNPILRDHDVRDIHDKTGNYFFRTIMQEAKPGQIATIHYLFPRPGGTVEEPKTTYYTRTGDQTCAVGVYDADTAAPAQATPEARLVNLRQKLDGEIPQAARADWNAFLETLNQVGDTRTAAIAKARDDLKAAEAALDPAEPK